MPVVASFFPIDGTPEVMPLAGARLGLAEPQARAEAQVHLPVQVFVSNSKDRGFEPFGQK